MKIILFSIYFLSTMLFYSVYSIAIDDFHCKIPICRDFYYDLKDYPRRNEYEKICFETVFRLQAIPRKHGLCIRSDTKEFNKACIVALANTIKSCMLQLSDLPLETARLHCGYKLMKYCAVYVGLDGYVLNFT